MKEKDYTFKQLRVLYALRKRGVLQLRRKSDLVRIAKGMPEVKELEPKGGVVTFTLTRKGEKVLDAFRNSGNKIWSE